ALLADRFKLAVHVETRERPAYALVIARRDKKLGPRIHPTTLDCAAPAGQSMLKEKEGKEKSKEEHGSATPAPASPGERPSCAMMTRPGRVSVSGVTMGMLATSLSESVQRTVVDRTDITGTFDIELTWTPDQMPPGLAADASKKGVKIDPNGPSIFTALQ